MNSENSPTSEEASTPDIVTIADMDEFVTRLVQWHTRQCAVIEQMLQMPEGATFQIDDDEEIVMTPPVLTGFKFGIEMTMMHLGILPFRVEMVDAEKESQEEPISAAL